MNLACKWHVLQLTTLGLPNVSCVRLDKMLTRQPACLRLLLLFFFLLCRICPNCTLVPHTHGYCGSIEQMPSDIGLWHVCCVWWLICAKSCFSTTLLDFLQGSYFLGQLRKRFLAPRLFANPSPCSVCIQWPRAVIMRGLWLHPLPPRPALLNFPPPPLHTTWLIMQNIHCKWLAFLSIGRFKFW